MKGKLRRIEWHGITFLTEWDRLHRRVARMSERPAEGRMMWNLRPMSDEEYRRWKETQTERRPA